MDLTSFIRSPAQIDRARELGARGLLCYQPFRFSPDCEVGVGWEFTKGEFAGLIHWPSPPAHLTASPEFRRLLCDQNELPQFRAANDRLRRTYDGFADAVCQRMGDISDLSFVDIGCNSGYFPLSFARRGAKEAVGYDREDYTDVFDLLNGVLGTSARFERRAYDLASRTIPDIGTYDVATCMLMLCHLPDPMNFLAFLGRTARRALFIWNGVLQDSRMLIHYGEAGKYYRDADFPNSFDYDTRLSTRLMLQSLYMMGFTEIHQLEPVADGLEMGHYIDKRPILAIRPDVPGTPLPDPAARFTVPADGGETGPALLGAFWNHNIIAYRRRFFAVPFGVPVDWDDPDPALRPDLFVDNDLSALCRSVQWDGLPRRVSR